jgi:hypothetical protein
VSGRRGGYEDIRIVVGLWGKLKVGRGCLFGKEETQDFHKEGEIWQMVCGRGGSGE